MNLDKPVRPELVVFDLDNTFYDYESAHDFAFSILQAELASSSGIAGSEIIDTYERARLNVKTRLGNTASSHSRLLYLSEYFSILNLGVDTSEILRLETDYWNAFLSKMFLFPNALEFLDKLLSLRTKCALVTDLTSEIQYRKIEMLGLQNKFQCVITSEEAGGDKSTSLPWKLLDTRVNFSEISTIWYIGDSKYDLNPSMRRSVDVGFLKTKQGHLTPTADHYSFSSFADLDHLIQ